jgi:3-isopropylmalate/(R)-2-methylmalate dehydratase small subunit
MVFQPMEPFNRLTSRLIPLPNRNVDTDQIIPARYLKTIDKTGLAEGLFHDWRYDPQGNPEPGFVLNQPEYGSAKILLVGDNFGCGSSREHAPWALLSWGIKVVISTSFADIFRNNAIKNGLLPVIVDQDSHLFLFDLMQEEPQQMVTIDLKEQVIEMPGGTAIYFSFDPFARMCLLNGLDQLGYILSFKKQIETYEALHPFFIA